MNPSDPMTTPGRQAAARAAWLASGHPAPLGDDERGQYELFQSGYLAALAEQPREHGPDHPTHKHPRVPGEPYCACFEHGFHVCAAERWAVLCGEINYERRVAAEQPREERETQLIAECERLRTILDHPDPHDFINASTVEAKFQMDLWGTAEGFPTAFDGQEDHHFVYLIAYLVGKVAATPDEDREKKLHRITTVAAAAANWHIVTTGRAAEQPRGELSQAEAKAVYDVLRGTDYGDLSASEATRDAYRAAERKLAVLADTKGVAVMSARSGEEPNA